MILILLTIFQFNALLDDHYKIKENYINIFSDKLDLTRIFVYKLIKNKISIESTSNQFDAKKINIAQSILKKYGIKNKIIIESANIKKDKRYNIISCRDKKSLSELKYKTKDSNLISCDWHTYGRNDKINSFIKNLKKKQII